jgi:hypothetical protein
MKLVDEEASFYYPAVKEGDWRLKDRLLSANAGSGFAKYKFAYTKNLYS